MVVLCIPRLNSNYTGHEHYNYSEVKTDNECFTEEFKSTHTNDSIIFRYPDGKSLIIYVGIRDSVDKQKIYDFYVLNDENILVYQSDNRTFDTVFELPSEDPREIMIIPVYFVNETFPLKITLAFLICEKPEVSAYVNYNINIENPYFPDVFNFLFKSYSFKNNLVFWSTIEFKYLNQKLSINKRFLPTPMNCQFTKDSLLREYNKILPYTSDEYAKCLEKEDLVYNAFICFLNRNIKIIDANILNLNIAIDCGSIKNPVFIRYFYSFCK